MAYSEIGSEFWDNDTVSETSPSLCDEEVSDRSRGFLSGRTALDYIIQDMKMEGRCSLVLLPSYCCDTMIEPFVKNGFGVRFYPVIPAENGIRCVLPEPRLHEAIYIMQYFGFTCEQLYEQEEIRQWEFAILDETHSCFSENKYSYEDWKVKYTYASYRKWADIRGYAIAKKYNGDFVATVPVRINERYMEYKNQACIEKKIYMESGGGDKQKFLGLYQSAEELLDEDYEDYGMTQEGLVAYRCLNREKLQKKRQENADYLIGNLKNIDGIHLLFGERKEGDCPLFVPILVKEGKRDKLRRYLIEHSIYCPVHWPVTKLHQFSSADKRVIYDMELSLICDQRYGLDEMRRIVEVITAFFRM